MATARAIQLSTDDRLAIARLDTVLLDSTGALRVVPAATLKQVPLRQRLAWMVAHGVYLLPTHELVVTLEEFFTKLLLVDRWDRSDASLTSQVIEIGSGNGALAQALGIRATDSKLQERADIAATYKALGQAPVPYGANVEKLEALDAVEKYRPRIVLGSWITQKIEAWEIGLMGNVDGVDETTMMGLMGRGDRARALVDETPRRIEHPPTYYLLIGNHAVHGDKKILKDARLEYKGFVGEDEVTRSIFSRGFEPEKDVIWLVGRADATSEGATT